MTDDLKPYDPRPEWMTQYHKETAGGNEKFKQWASANLNIDIDDQLQYDQGASKAGIAELVLKAITNQIPFILHNGPQRFCVIIPKLRVIAIYAHTGSQTEILTDTQFANRVKMLYVIYPKFATASVKLLQSALELTIQQHNGESK